MADIDFSKIQLLVLDVDGVMTDGRIILTPAGDEIKEFHVRDGSAMLAWRRLGKKLAIITGRSSPVVELRARSLGVDALHVGAADKLPAYEAVLAQLGCTPDQTAVIGDDLTDLPILTRCLLPIAVGDACDEAKLVSAYVTRAGGGRGAVREAVELILHNAGLWETLVARYLPQGLQPREKLNNKHYRDCP